MNDPEIFKELKESLQKHKTNIIIVAIAVWVMFSILDRMSESYKEFEIEYNQQKQLQLAHEQRQAAKNPGVEKVLTPLEQQNKLSEETAGVMSAGISSSF